MHYIEKFYKKYQSNKMNSNHNKSGIWCAFNLFYNNTIIMTNISKKCKNQIHSNTQRGNSYKLYLVLRISLVLFS